MIKHEEEIRIYLAGPMAGCTDSEMLDWRHEVISQFKGICLSPTRRDYRHLEGSREQSQMIVTMDKLDIGQSDVVLANCYKPSHGTSMEVPYGFDHGKLVVIIIEDDEVRKFVSPWLIYHSHHIAISIEDALDFIRDYFEVD